MKKQGRKIWLTITMALIMLISSFACLHFPLRNNKSTINVGNCVFAENENISYSLVPSNYYTDPDKEAKYNLSSANQDSFTPFDFETESRMPGNAFKFTEGENQQINNQFVKFDSHNDIDKNDSLAIVFWLYVDGIRLHNLELTIEFENGSSLKFTINRIELESLLMKENQDNLLPYAYNKFVFPLTCGEAEGDIYNGDVLYAPTKMVINYSSLIPEEQKSQSFAKLYFYDVKLETSAQTEICVVEKQNYYISSFNLIPKEIAENVCVGDQYKIPFLSQVVRYAYKGKENLLNAANNYNWRIRVIVPDDKSTQEIYNFGDTITFAQEGVYKIYYECVHSQEGNVQVDLYARNDVEVNSVNGIYFGKTKLNVFAGTGYKVTINTSTLLSNISDIEFEFDENSLAVDYDENGEVVVTAKKTGTFKLSAKITANRQMNPNMQEYKAELEIVSKQAPSNLGYRIFLIVSLSVIGLTLLISVVILVVKSKKIVVK